MLTRTDQWHLRRSGFTIKEISDLNNARTPDGKLQPRVNIDSPVWKDVFQRRKQWINDIQNAYNKAGKTLTRSKLDNIIDNFISKGKKRSIFDWLKREYRPKLVKDFIPRKSVDVARQKAKARTDYYMRQTRLIQ